MKKLVLIGIMLSLGAILFLGCSDDDCPSCPQLTQEGIAIIYALIDDGELESMGIMYGIDGSFIDVDSVKIDNYDYDVRKYFGEGMATYCSTYDQDITGYNQGDSVTIRIYQPNGMTECHTILLVDSLDSPEINEYAVDYPYDTVAQLTQINISWPAVPNADFYAVDWEYNHDHGGTNMRYDTMFTTTNTSFSIPASYLGYDGRLYLDVYSFTGPDFDGAGNINSSLIKGRVASVAGEYFTIYVGTGDPYPVGTVVPEEEEREVDYLKLIESLH